MVLPTLSLALDVSPFRKYVQLFLDLQTMSENNFIVVSKAMKNMKSQSQFESRIYIRPHHGLFASGFELPTACITL